MMLKSKKNQSLWIVVVLVAVVTALTTVAVLMLRAKYRRKRLKKGETDETCTCMSFDCESADDAEDSLEDMADEELSEEPQE